MRQMEKRIQGDPTKRESEQFHSIWVEKIMQAMRETVEMAEEVAIAKKVVAKVSVQLCLGRHQRLGPARI
jgi:hypothetical protein